MTATTLDSALERFAARGPEFAGGLSNHGPMAAEALAVMGREDAVEPWSEWYAARLVDPPQPRNPIDPAAWREALGDISRAGDWSAFFRRQLAGAPWRDVVADWAVRLAPGVFAGATHGVIRTAHAVRTLERGETPQRLNELAEGFAYWAARYYEIPAAAPASGALSVPDALARIEIPADRPQRGFITTAVRAIANERFAPVINYADVSGNPGEIVSALAAAFVRQYLANARTASIAFIHTVTAPEALRTLAPHLPHDAVPAVLRYAWQACAAVYAAYGHAPDPALDIAPLVDFDEADLIDQAVHARDEHAIKFTEACLREYRISADPAFIHAARDVVARLAVRN